MTLVGMVPNIEPRSEDMTPIRLPLEQRELDEDSVQLGFGVCANDELHGDVEYFCRVEHRQGVTSVHASVFS
jgi:hypothetical protein